MKLLTVAIPCYNSEEYMEKSIRSALNGGEKVEVLIIDDGSTDSTLKIAKKYEKKFPDIVRVIHQENGGHGDAVNTGIKNATGIYFKVLDSDDVLGKKAMGKVLAFLEKAVANDFDIDMVITNFMYDKQGVRRKKIMKYKSAMPVDKIITWDDVKLGKTQFLLMHSVMYRTKILKECGLELPKHTFYVDNIYVFTPLPYVKKIYYLDVVFYKYYIGREDQSVNESVMIKRLDQQYRVTRIMLDDYCDMNITNEKLDNVLVHYFDMMMCISTIMSIREGSKARLKDKDELWKHLEEKNLDLYKRVRHSLLGRSMNVPGKYGRKVSVALYKIVQGIFGFN
ncbi:MAG: glycosyltransferase family 2 protein [Eubacterium sp.]|nr:glycosyltransferase family 2 protein [Eubacterium sp.]